MARKFTKKDVELIYWILERELKPPFTCVHVNNRDEYKYHNRDNEYVGWLYSETFFDITGEIYYNILTKICIAFEFPANDHRVWYAIKSYVRPWFENQLNTELDDIS